MGQARLHAGALVGMISVECPGLLRETCELLLNWM